jgi:dienelactone hydrolase
MLGACACLSASLLTSLLLASFPGAASAQTASPQAASADPAWSITRDVELVSRWPVGRDRIGEDRVTADLYRPLVEGRIPAAVIINSSGGVQPHTEINYAHVFARNGMASLVVDSFTPRGVRRTADDQTRVFQSKSNADAIAGFRWLAAQPWVDQTRIIVIGMSRGGEAAYSAALEALRRRMGATDIRFAAHVAVTPGGCNLPRRDARTTGAPIFFMFGELDDGTPVLPCIDYIQRMRQAGNANVRFAVYPGVYHAYDSAAGIHFGAEDWTAAACAGRFFADENGVLFDRASGQRATAGNQTDYLWQTCLSRGYTVGGDERVKAQAIADLVQFLRDVQVLHDDEARAIVPDCSSIPEGIVRRNCIRARNGWTGDIVALARAYRYPGGPARDDRLAARLFEFAGMRGQPAAKWELALMLRQGAGLAPDAERALRLARESAEAGEAAGANVYGVMIRDGIGRPRDDAQAAVWFRRAADQRNPFGMTNLGEFLWNGRGGLAQDRGGAIVLWTRAVLLGDIAWAHVFLARAFAGGEGVAPDAAKANEHYRAAAAQERDGNARRAAAEALARPDGQAQPPR